MIAGGQTLKSLRSVKDMTLQTGTVSAKESIKSMTDTAKGLAESSKVCGVLGKIFSYISKNINQIICISELFRVAGSDDKADTAARSTLRLSGMFAFEHFGKKFLGMPYTQCINGKLQTVSGDALYKSLPFVSKHINAMEKLFNKIDLTPLPPIVKGISFVVFSICGYKFGSWVADKLLGKEKCCSSKTKNTNTTPVTTKAA